MEGIDRSTSVQDTPWLGRPDWARGEARPTIQRKLIGATVVLIISTAISTLFIIKAPNNFSSVFLFYFTAVTLLATVSAAINFIKKALQYLRFRRVRCKLSTLPGTLGGEFAATILLSSPATLTGPLTVTLQCLHRRKVRQSESGSRQSQFVVPLWQTSKVVKENEFPSRSLQTIPVRFLLPYEGRPSYHGDNREEVSWILHVEAPMKGSNLALSFCVPVYHTSKSDPSLTEGVIRSQEEKFERDELYRKPDDTQTTPFYRFTQLQPNYYKVRTYSWLRRSPLLFVGAAAVVLGYPFLLWFAFSNLKKVILLAKVFIALGVMIVGILGALFLFFLLVCTTVTVEEKAVRLTLHFCGLCYTLEFPLTTPMEVHVDIASSMTVENRSTLTYQVTLSWLQGELFRSWRICSGFSSEQEARKLANLLTKILNIKNNSY